MNLKNYFIILSVVALNLIYGCQYPYSNNKHLSSEDLRLDPIFTNNMVLQRDKVIKIKGWADVGSNVNVSLAGKHVKAIANPNGEWIAELPPIKAGGPYKLTVKGERTVKTLNDILIGDIWICSGQSNMAWSVARSHNAKEEVKNARYPRIRLFTVSRTPSPTPLKELSTFNKWQVCSPETVSRFSAVGYFFGRNIHKEMNVPIGLINTSWGGTVAEAWTSIEMLQTLPSFEKRINNIPKRDKKSIAEAKKKNIELKKIMRVRNKEVEKLYRIEADESYAIKMSAPTLDDSTWNTMKVPTIWEKAGLKDFDGLVIFRKTINVPKSWSGKELKLALGPIDEVDVTYFNGVKVGGKGSMKNNITKFWNKPRLYTVPSNLVKDGKNTITCLVYDLVGGGGLAGGKSKDMKAYISTSPDNSISLAGLWKYKPELQVLYLSPALKMKTQNTPAFLFNGMINPLLDFPITGAIWYQGESNAGRAYQYQRLFPAMIQDWRIRWKQGDFPFYFVQLANFKNRGNEPSESAWAELREAQAMTLRLPNTGMAVIIDIREAKDIHPKNKQDVGKRLAQNALSSHYQKNLIPAGPLYQKVIFKNGKAKLTFKNIGKGLLAKDGDLKGFTISGKDQKFFLAKAIIKDNHVIVWSEKLKTPVALRYGWANNPECNLYNKEGFPASPFRTDKWAGVTVTNK